MAGIQLSHSTDALDTRLGLGNGWGPITGLHRQLLRMGMDSLIVLVLYSAGIAGLIAVTNR